MNTQSELIVHFDKNFVGTILLILLPFLSIAAFKLFLVPINSFKATISSSYFSYVLVPFQVIIGFSIVLFAFLWFYLLIQMIDKQPVAILNKQGIWINRHGLIPWQHIEAIYPYISHPDNVKNLPVQIQAKNIAVGIKIKKDSLFLISEQSSWGGKSVLFWAKLLGNFYAKFLDYHHHITLSCTNIPAEEIISFAHRYIK